MMLKKIIIRKGKEYFLRKTCLSFFNAEDAIKEEKDKGRQVIVKGFDQEVGGVPMARAHAIYSTNKGGR